MNTITLRVRARHYVAHAVWGRTSEGWRCIAAEPRLMWMVGMSARTAKARLVRERVVYDWF
jgi:hypothetical protein